MARRFWLLGLCTLVAACSTTPSTHFYTLAALPADAAKTVPVKDKRLAIGLTNVMLPAYTDRPQIVTSTTSTTMALNEFDSWVEPLSSMSERILTQDLRILLGTDKVVMLPQPREVSLDYQVGVDVARFDAVKDGNMTLIARWTVSSGNGDKLLRDGAVNISEPVPASPTLDGVVTVMSAGWNRLAADIAKAISDLARAKQR